MSASRISEPVMQVRGVSKVYRLGEVEVHALRRINLELRAGELVVILGASGSGKSTLLNILGGLDTPTQGEVRYRDHVLSNATDRALTRYRREHVGFVFQFFNLLPSLTALENVELVTEIAADAISPREVLERVGLADRLHHFPSQLSGGEQQRVAIARALANAPRLLLADEPTGNLDPTTSAAVFENLYALARKTGVAALVATHNLELARHMDRIVALKDGHLEERAAPAYS